MPANPPPQTLAQKIIARAAGVAEAPVGAILTCRVDLAFAHDSSGPRRWKPQLEALGARLWDPSKVVIASDHYVPAVDAESAAILKLTRAFAADYGVAQFFDMEGIAHTLLPQKGLLRPGMFIAGGDSHSPHAGAFGCYSAGYGATDMLGVVATGETWLEVPATDRFRVEGGFGLGVAAKDVMLWLCRRLGMENAGKVIEYAGDAVAGMSMDERMTLTNMSAELGYDTGLIAPDETTLAHIRAHGGDPGPDPLQWRSDLEAALGLDIGLNAPDLAPQVAAPHSPANSDAVGAHEGTRIDQAYIGACVGAKLEDLRMAAQVLRGRRVAKGVRLLLAPASRVITAQAAEEGVLGALLEAGATLMPSGCGACAGMGAGILAAGETCLSTTNRNFKGRMGHDEAFVYLGSAYTVAAAAVTGRIVDPRPLLADAKAAA
jgi:3-isopropylmalate/(R)-2-methylmalate dehydratase large subunit